MFTVLFAIPRAAGWLAQWNELMTDAEQKISRPRQIYLGEQHRKVTTHNRAADPIAVRQRRPVAVR
jgi:citrate synthase